MSTAARMTRPALVCAAVLSGLFAGCGRGEDKGQGSESGNPSEVRVVIEDFKFLPPQATVKTGGSISFVNRDKAPHTAESEAFDSGRLDRGQSKRITFDTPGTYEYFCDFHRFMTARVQVTE